ncbi:MAG: penicillin-binding protein 1C [Massilia sp.]
MQRPASIVLLILALGAGGARAAVPGPEQVKAAWRASDTTLLDRHGVAIESTRADLTARRGGWVALADISPVLGAAVLQAEDQHFMQHGGVDLGAVGQAAWDNLFARKARGASTITMQLAALLDPALRGAGGGRSWGQKWDQAMAARELEAGWSKQQILEAYLNMVPFRGELIGVGAASRALFGKVPGGLDRAESAILASLLRAPVAAPRLVAKRACALAKELDAAAACAPIEWQTEVALGRPAALAILTPAPQVARKLLGAAGSSTRSTLDASLQRFAQDSLRQHLAVLRERNVGDGAAIVIDNASGEILAWVGNTGDSEVDGVTALRQAGSTLKPFLYELAFERGLLTAASLLDDSPIGIATAGGLYVPKNYDNEFKGFVSARTSLASSLNVPAVRTLVLTGQDRFHTRLREVGLTSLTEAADYYGDSLALGSAEVNLLELANAYRTLANQGVYSETRLRPGPAGAGKRVMDARASFIVADILSDRAARSLTFGLRNELGTSFWSAVKTGTSKDMRDNWCMGFSERYTVGVWVGNFDGSSMWDVSGVTGAAPVWRDLMDYLHQHLPSRAPAPPKGVLRRQIAFQPALEAERAEWFVAGTETALVTLAPSTADAPTILYPVDGSIIATDPDIPEPMQRVMFRAADGKGLTWRLNGATLAGAEREYAWKPAPGKYALALFDAQDKMVTSVRFEVRGEALATARR